MREPSAPIFSRPTAHAPIPMVRARIIPVTYYAVRNKLNFGGWYLSKQDPAVVIKRKP